MSGMDGRGAGGRRGRHDCACRDQRANGAAVET